MKNFGHLVYLLSALLLASAGCSGRTDTGATANAHNNAARPLRQSEYIHLTGTVGDLAVTADLMREPSPYDTSWFYRGYYYYDTYEELIPLYGAPDSTGQIVLTEAAGWDQASNAFTGRLGPDGAFSGIWSSADNQRQLPFNLKAAAGAMRFALKSYVDSLVALPGNPKSPVSYFRFDWMEGASGNADLDGFVSAAVRKGLVGDSLAGRHNSLDKAIEVLKEDYFANYQTEVQGMLSEGIIDTTEGMFSLNYETDQSVFIYYNNGKLLTVGYNSYSYSGGAHGMHGTSVYSYDLESRKEIRIEDVLLPGYEAKIAPALAKAVRKRYQLSPSQPLSEVLFEDEVAPNENFGLTGKGIFFVYAPYEIAAYAAGEIELFIPFADIKPLLQPAYAALIQ